MNYTLHARFKKEPPQISEFSYRLTENWLYLWVNDVYIGASPFTYTVEEALEDFCEDRDQIFRGIFYVVGGDLKYGTYLWRRV